MIGRLANVLYWTGCGVAALAAILGAACLGFPDGDKLFGVAALVIAALAWLIGRACRYVLAGR